MKVTAVFIGHSLQSSCLLCRVIAKYQLLVNETLIPALLVKVLPPAVAVTIASTSVLPASAGVRLAEMRSTPGVDEGATPPGAKSMIFRSTSPIFKASDSTLRTPVVFTWMKFGLASVPTEQGGSV